MRPFQDRRWCTFVLLPGVSLGLGLLVAYGLDQLVTLQWPAFLVIAFGVSAAIDLLLVWEHERAVAAGEVRLCNDIVGEVASVCCPFARSNGLYRGRVRLGGEQWVAASRIPLGEGEEVKVIGRDGLCLHVEPAR